MARFRIYKYDTSTISGTTDTLGAAITSTTATAITLSSGTATVNGTQLQCGSERMFITAGAGTANLTVQRGYGGTTAATHLNGASVSIAGALVFDLLQVGTVANQTFTHGKTSTDINFVKLVPFSGDTLPSSAAYILLADSSAALGTAVLIAPASGSAWLVTAGAGGTGAAATAGPSAPNITSATGAAAYSLLGNESIFGFSGVITLPTTDPEYSQLTTITVLAFAPSSTSGIQIAQLTAPFSGSTVAYSGGQIPMPTSGQTWTLNFVVANPAGTSTASPVSITVSVGASAITSLTGGDASALLITDPNYVARTVDQSGSPHTAIWYIPVITGAIFPQVVSTFYNPGDGTGWHYMASVTMTAAGQVFYMPGGTYVPTLASETWQLAAVTGWVNANGVVSSLPSGAVDSSTFTVLEVGAISASEFTLVFQNDPANSTLYDTAGPFNPGYYTWRFYNLAITFPASDVNLWDVRLTAQEGTVVSGVFTASTDGKGVERQFAALSFLLFNGTSVQSAMGTTVNINGPTAPVNGVQVPDWTWPNTTTNWVTRIRAYAVSRLGTGPTGGSGTQTLLTGWPSSADHFDLTPTPPAGALNATNLVSGTVSSTLIPAVAATAITGSITSGQIGSVAASTITGSITSGQITSVTAGQITGSITSGQISSVAASTITGSITSGQITSVTAGQITGSITAGQISSVNTSAFSGTISSTQIASVNTATITVGTLSSGQISSVSASSVGNGLVSTQISSVAATTITGQVVAAQISTVNASSISGSISASQIGSVNASAITGTISATNIGTINASTVTISGGGFGPSQIASVNAGQINAGSITGSTLTLNTNSVTTTVANTTQSGAFSGAAISMVNNSTGQKTYMQVGGFTVFDGTGANLSAFMGFVSGTGGVITAYNTSGVAAIQIRGDGELVAGGNVIINSSGTFVGAGVNCPSYAVGCAGVNPTISGTLYDGQSWNIVFGSSFTITGVGGSYTTLIFKGGILVSAS